MKEKSCWIYQSSKAKESWAIHLTARKERRKIRADTDIYADWISIPSKKFHIADMSIEKPTSWIDTIGRVLAAYDHHLTDCDRKQLEHKLNDLKESFLD